LRQSFELLMTASKSRQALWVEAVVRAIDQKRSFLFRFERSAKWAENLARLYPGDVGVVLSLFLNVLVLQPGEAVYLPAGNLHAYLEGTGIELMANSDNVLRGGLTPKHVDVGELLSVLKFTASEVAKVHAEANGGVEVYKTPAEEFQLSRITVERTRPAQVAASAGPEIWLVTEGTLDLKVGERALRLEQGQSAALPVRSQALSVSGRGVAFCAALPGSVAD
jgi:mannose-6-phosphate isomerase